MPGGPAFLSFVDYDVSRDRRITKTKNADQEKPSPRSSRRSRRHSCKPTHRDTGKRVQDLQHGRSERRSYTDSPASRVCPTGPTSSGRPRREEERGNEHLIARPLISALLLTPGRRATRGGGTDAYLTSPDLRHSHRCLRR